MNPTVRPPGTVPLAQHLRTLATELRAASPPPLRRAAPPTSAPRLPSLAVPARGWLLPAPRRFAWAGVAACLLVLIASAWLMAMVRPGPDTRELARASGFLPVAPIDEWTRSDGSADAAWLVATEMPNERLAALGLPYDPARAGENVRAELLMRASGEVLAVRVVR